MNENILRKIAKVVLMEGYSELDGNLFFELEDVAEWVGMEVEEIEDYVDDIVYIIDRQSEVNEVSYDTENGFWVEFCA